METGVDRGTEVTPFYDPLLAKLIAHGATREEARLRLVDALSRSRIAGMETNLDYLREALALPEFVAGQVHTGLLARWLTSRPASRSLDGGTQTTVQDWPGRVGYWDVGVPPSGPMDALSFRLANRLLGNPQGAPGSSARPSVRRCSSAPPPRSSSPAPTWGPTLDGVPVARFRPVHVPAGGTLILGAVRRARAPRLPRRARRHRRTRLPGQPQHVHPRPVRRPRGPGAGRGRRSARRRRTCAAQPTAALPDAAIPPLTREWEIARPLRPARARPTSSPRGHRRRSSRPPGTSTTTRAAPGVRLIGPKPRWARTDGGEAGLHPSNIHDNAYAVGTIDFTGDMPILLGPDGPSLGGFVCPATIVAAELWKMGQLKAGRSGAIRARVARRGAPAPGRRGSATIA